MASEKRYVIGRDGHLMSESEVEEATQLDEPVSTDGAPDTRAALVIQIGIDRNRESIRKLEQAIERDTAELAAEKDVWWQNYLKENLVQKRRRIVELESEIAAAHRISS